MTPPSPGPPPGSSGSLVERIADRLTLEALLSEAIRPRTRPVSGRRRLQASRDNDILW